MRHQCVHQRSGQRTQEAALGIDTVAPVHPGPRRRVATRDGSARRSESGDRLADVGQRLEHARRVGRRAREGDADGDDGLARDRRRVILDGRGTAHEQGGHHIVGGAGHEVIECGGHLASPLRRMDEDAASDDRADGPELELQRGHDAEVGAGASHAPRTGRGFWSSLAWAQAPIGRHHLDLNQKGIDGSAPACAANDPIPPPRVSPATPVCETVPALQARPCACAASVEVAQQSTTLAAR